MAETVIKVENLSKKYLLGTREHTFSVQDALLNIFKKNKPPKPFWALKDINFEIKKGEVLGIIGANGAGKSTILKILSQITPPTTGKITIKGRVASLLEIGTGFHQELTGRENIYLNGAILGMGREEIKRKFDEIVSFAGIPKFLDTPVKRYSSGMYVRLAFAVAAHLDPEILIVDEVLAVGDAEFQKKCLGKMKDVSKGGRTVIFVSHNMGAVANLCSRVIYLENGKAKFIGETKKGIAKYAASNTNENGRLNWSSPLKAPGNKNVKLKYVKITSKKATGNTVFIDQDIVIEMGYWNLKPNAHLASSIHLKDSSGLLVFASANFPSACQVKDEWYSKPRPKGLYKSSCVVPANFLNDGQYILDVGISNHQNEYEFNLQDLVSFQVVESGEMKKEYMGQWGGVVRPKLIWKTEKIK